MSTPNNSQPTILVKKPDGSFVRMTLDEVKKMRQGSGAPAPVAPVSAPAPAPKAQIAPAVSANVPTPPKPTLPKLMAEQKPKAATMPQPSSAGADPVGAIASGLSFKVAPDLQNRLRTIIQLFTKEVRDERQTRSVVLRPALSGGLGITAGQCDELIQKCRSVAHLPQSTATVPTIKDLKQKKVSEPVVDIEDAAGPAPMALAVPQARPAPTAQNTPKLAPVPVPASPPIAEKFSLSTKPVAKPTMHDITAAAPEMGPTEEIRYLTLVDFHRLSGNAAEAAARVRQLFTNLEEESIVLYLEGLESWRQSPLYQSYVQTAAAALVTRKALETVTKETKTIDMNEIEPLVKMEETLPYLQ